MRMPYIYFEIILGPSISLIKQFIRCNFGGNFLIQLKQQCIWSFTGVNVFKQLNHFQVIHAGYERWQHQLRLHVASSQS